MTRAWQLALVAWLAMSGPVAAQDPAAEQVPESPRDLFVVTGRSATGFESAHEGLAARIRERLAAARLRVHDGARSRQAGQTGKLDTPALLERASSEQSGRALLVDLWVEPRALHIGLRLYELDTKTLIGVARDTTTRGELWRAGDTALLALLPKLSVQPLVLPKRAAQDIGELSIVGRALAAMDRGDLVRAWNELEGRRSSAVTSLRRMVQRLADDPATPPAMQARLLSARGNAEGAWDLIVEQVEQ